MADKQDEDDQNDGRKPMLERPSEKGSKIDENGRVRTGERKGCFEKWGMDYAEHNASTVSSWAQIK